MFGMGYRASRLASPLAGSPIFGRLGPTSPLAKPSVGDSFCVKTGFFFSYDPLAGSIGDGLIYLTMLPTLAMNVFLYHVHVWQFRGIRGIVPAQISAIKTDTKPLFNFLVIRLSLLSPLTMQEVGFN